MLKFNSIRTSSENKLIVSELTSKLSLGTENVIARIALGFSLAKHGELDLLDIEDSKGKEYSSRVLLGENKVLYIALICQKYNIYKETTLPLISVLGYLISKILGSKEGYIT